MPGVTTPEDLLARLEALDTRIRALETAPRLPQFSVFGGQGAYVATSELVNMGDISYQDLATNGPEVTVTVGETGRLFIYWQTHVEFTGAGGTDVAICTYRLSGANVVPPDDTYAAALAAENGLPRQMGRGRVVSGLAAGETIVKLKYRPGTGTSTSLAFSRRELVVIPL